MSRQSFWVGILALLGVATHHQAAIAGPGNTGILLADCPIAGRPFSLDTPIYDILTNPRVRGAVEQIAPDLVKKAPAVLLTEALPSAGTIFPLRLIAGPAERAASIERMLAALPVTHEDNLRRCARYDYGRPPRLPAIGPAPAFLVFDHSNGYRDDPSVNSAREALASLARTKGWQLVFTDRAASFNRRDLAKFKAVIWNNVSGDVLTLRQRAAFERYIASGGGYIGIHGSGGDPLTYWDWYVDRLVGARFKGHPMNPQFQAARLVVDDPASPITAGLGSGWTMTDEWYSFRSNPRAAGAHVLLTLDESTYTPQGSGGDLRMGDHPIAWTRCVGKGRSFYSAIGHLPQSYTNPSVQLLLAQGIGWAAGLTVKANASC